jgi:uncharacterized membrane protein
LEESEYIDLLDINENIAYLTINFSKPLALTLPLRIYITNDSYPDFTDRNSLFSYIGKSANFARFDISAKVSSLRIDTGDNKIGEAFELDSIVLNRGINIPFAVQRLSIKLALTLSLILSLTTATLLLYHKVRLEYVYLACAIPLGVLYLAALTPLSVPDEQYHYYRSYCISNLLLLQKNTEIIDNHVDFTGFMGHHNSYGAYERLLKEGFFFKKTNSIGALNAVYADNISFNFISYLPQAFGILIARALSMNIFGVFLMGRLLNMIFFALCVSLSIKKLKCFRVPLSIFGLMPMALHQAASFSYDSLINGLSVLLIAHIFNAIYENKTELLPLRDYIWITVIALLLSPNKVVYLPLITLVFLINPKRFGGKKDYLIKTVTVFILCVALNLILNHSMITKIGMNGSEALNWQGRHNYTISYIIDNPAKTIGIFLNTLWKNGKFYLHTSVGQIFSGLSLRSLGRIPRWMIALLFLSVFTRNDGKSHDYTPSIYQRSFYLVISVSIIGLFMLAMFLTCTSDTNPIILGVQGRYFIPIVPLVLFSIKNRYAITQKWYVPSLILGTLLVNSAVLMDIFRQTAVGNFL